MPDLELYMMKGVINKEQKLLTEADVLKKI